GASEVSGRHVTVTAPKWDADGLAAGESVTVGFVARGSGDPLGCRVDGAACSADPGATPEPSGRPTGTPTSAPAEDDTGSVTPAPTATDDTATEGAGGGTAGGAGFAPYVDTSLHPS
ncbi:sugar hydrolase, partial [Streptomyces sp. TRM76130]|nr:sugar hydrolase [Streptomyces sp. TRM76130]